MTYVETCPNCGRSVTDHAPKDADTPSKDSCPLLREHVRRAIAVASVIFFARDNE
ncbi:MAG: hypothetical protein KGL39_37160 [Patescibacteria group bacterium]|nr:hypothetical protein [Patescibacteria group bacterium]